MLWIRQFVGDEEMTRFTRIMILAVVTLAPVIAIAGPSEDASTVIDRWAAAFSANDLDAVVRLYAPDAILLGTVSPILAEGTEPIISGSPVRVWEGRRISRKQISVFTLGATDRRHAGRSTSIGLLSRLIWQPELGVQRSRRREARSAGEPPHQD